MWMSVVVENSTTATTKPTAAMCSVHFAALVLRAIGTHGLGILIAVVVNVRHARLSTATVAGNVVMKQDCQSASKSIELMYYLCVGIQFQNFYMYLVLAHTGTHIYGNR